MAIQSCLLACSASTSLFDVHRSKWCYNKPRIFKFPCQSNLISLCSCPRLGTGGGALRRFGPGDSPSPAALLLHNWTCQEHWNVSDWLFWAQLDTLWIVGTPTIMIIPPIIQNVSTQHGRLILNRLHPLGLTSEDTEKIQINLSMTLHDLQMTIL